MPVIAPLRVPVELRRENGARWFRLTGGISEDGLVLARPLPPELDGPLALTFFLPFDEGPADGDGDDGEARPIRVTGRALEPIVDEEQAATEGRVLFVHPDEETRSRIASYVEGRLLASP